MENAEIEKIRNLLIEKIGMSKDYECGNYTGDHAIWNDKEFNLRDIGDLESIDISPEIFQNIYENYIDDIIEVIKRNSYMKVHAIMDKGDMSEFNEDRIKAEFKSFMNGEMKLNSRNKITIKTFLELINTYNIEDLLNENETVKKELQNGVFDLIKDEPDAFSKEDREKINKLDWKKEDVDNYYNLPLLYERLTSIKEKGNIDNSEMLNLCGMAKYLLETGIPMKDEKISFGKKEKTKSDFYSRLMSNIYENYEIINREDIVRSLYSSKGDVNIEKYDDIPDNMLLHYYGMKNDDLKCIFIGTIINRERLKNGEEILKVLEKDEKGKPIEYRYPELEEKYKDKIKEANIDDCVNELKPDVTFNITEEDIENGLGYRLEVLKGTQLACTTKSREKILESEYYLDFAIGFGNNIQPQNIILACDRNADSNLGIEHIPCKNKFKELSKTYDEIQSSKEDIREILLDRKNLKPEYFVCMYDREKIEQDEDEQCKRVHDEAIKKELKKAKELGLDIIMIDRTKIREERQKNEMENGEYSI